MTLKEYAAKQNLKQSDLAKLLGVSCASVSLYFDGKRTPSAKMMNQIYKVTKGQVTANDILGHTAAPLTGTAPSG